MKRRTGLFDVTLLGKMSETVLDMKKGKREGGREESGRGREKQSCVFWKLELFIWSSAQLVMNVAFTRLSLLYLLTPLSPALWYVKECRSQRGRRLQRRLSFLSFL